MSGRDPGLERLWRTAGSLLGLVLGVSALAALAGWRPSAWFLVAAVAALVAAHLAISTVAYRRTMNRPWPRVSPLPDEDDW